MNWQGGCRWPVCRSARQKEAKPSKVIVREGHGRHGLCLRSRATPKRAGLGLWNPRKGTSRFSGLA